MSGFFITGTDTEVGKTFVACALIAALRKGGQRVAAMKPVAAGTIHRGAQEINEDVADLQEATGHHYPLHAVNPYCFREAIAPHIAAAHEGVAVEMTVIETAYRALAGRADLVLVEGAGGFLVPLSDTVSMASIPLRLELPVILVVAMRLGCINHALLSVEAIHARNLVLAGWVANSPQAPMNAYTENLSTLRRLIPAPCLGEIPQCLPVPTGTPAGTPTRFEAAAHHLDVQPLLDLMEKP